MYKHVNTVRSMSPVPLAVQDGRARRRRPDHHEGRHGFHSGTLDYYVGGYDLKTGHEIWSDRLPAGGQAKPYTYQGADGLQYFIVVAGGHGSTGTAPGDSIIAYFAPMKALGILDPYKGRVPHRILCDLAAILGPYPDGLVVARICDKRPFRNQPRLRRDLDVAHANHHLLH